MTLRLLTSPQTWQRLEARIRVAVATKKIQLALVNDAEPIDLAFISRDITGRSTKHEVLPATQAYYDRLSQSESLKWVHIHSAGADRPVYEALVSRGVTVTTSAGNNSTIVAQTVLAVLLGFARRLPEMAQAQRERRWSPLLNAATPADLAGQHAVIVGWGPIGQQIANYLKMFDVSVTAIRRQNIQKLADHLPQAQWVILACPLTLETRALIDEKMLALMPKDAHLLNISRGPVVVEADLVNALNSGRLAGAYLDVFDHEPLPEHSALWGIKNCIVTPHSAGFSSGNESRVDEIFLENLNRYALSSQ